MNVEIHPRTDEERHYYAFQDKAWRILAPVYDGIVLPVRKLRRVVAKAAGVGTGSRVLDVATGTGAQALAFADAGAEVVGIDISESMLRVARRHAGNRRVTFRAADATELPFEDGSFDVCSVSFALHEMPPSVRERAVHEMARVTNADGKIVIVDYALPDGPIASKVVFRVVKLYEGDNYAEFIRSDLAATLGRAGLAIVDQMRWWSPIGIIVASKKRG